MLLNTNQVNDGILNGDTGSSAFSLLYIEKDITLQVSQAAQTLLSIAKNITADLSAQTLLFIQKDITSVALPNTFYDRNGWEPIIQLGYQAVLSNVLHGTIEVVKNEDDNHTAEFTMLLPPAVYDLHNYQGKSVIINIRKGDVITRLFTGQVDIPTVDVLNEKLTLRCVADRRKLLGGLGATEGYIGYYSYEVLGAANDVYERINARLTTTPSSLDFDGANNATLTSWTPKASAEYIYGSSAVYRRDPQLTIESSAKIVNQVNLTMEYGFQRMHHRQANFQWNHPYAPLSPTTGVGGICPFLKNRPSMPTKELIRSAVQGAGWPVYQLPSIADPYNFGKQFRSGTYQCTDRSGRTAWVQWSTMESGTLTAPIVDSNGVAVLDATGNPLMRSVTTVIADNTDLYTMNASWIATTRFNQNVKESYTISVTAPTSQAIYGVLSTVENYGVTSNDDYASWETYDAYQIPPTGVTLHSDAFGSYFFNGDQDRSRFNNACISALNKANTTILASHRDTHITFQRELIPGIELRHTVELTGKWVRGKGKCQRITHTMNIDPGDAYTEVVLAQYRGVGSATNSALVAPTLISDVYVLPQVGASLGTHLGVNPDSNGSELWTGYVGNVYGLQYTSEYPQGNYTRTFYQESFTVDVPAIPDQIRQDRGLYAAQSYSVNIPTDDTEYQSYG